MLLSLVIPAWNAERYLEETVRSVISQTKRDWKLVIIDDGSKDRTREIALELTVEDSRISVICQPNGGLSAARNTGFDAVCDNSDSVLFLDADDVLEPTALAELHAALENAAPDVVGVYGLPRDMTVTGNLIDIPLQEAWGYNREAVTGVRTRKLAVEEPSSFGTFVIWCTIQTAGQALVKVSSLREAGPWRSMPSEDSEMWLRLAALGPFVMLPRFTLRKRISPNSLSSDGKWRAKAAPIIRNTLASDVFTKEQRSVARIGELRAVGLRFSWAIDALKKGAVADSIRQFYRAIRALAIFAVRCLRY